MRWFHGLWVLFAVALTGCHLQDDEPCAGCSQYKDVALADHGADHKLDAKGACDTKPGPDRGAPDLVIDELDGQAQPDAELHVEPDATAAKPDAKPAKPDAKPPCPALGPGAPAGVVLHEAGYQLSVYAKGLSKVAGVAVEPGGGLLLGSGMGATGAGPVWYSPTPHKVAAAPWLKDPDGVGLDSKGRPYVGGQTVIWRADSLAALSAKAKPWYGWATVGGNINDLQLDAKDVVHVARNNGTIWRVDPAQSPLKPEQLHPWGDEASIAVHPKTQNVWAIQRNKGKLVEIHRGTLVITTRAHWAKAGVVRTNRIAWHPTDGRLYATSFVKPKGGYVLRWDPAKPQKLETWISGLNEKKAPDGVAWNAAGTCLYYTAPLSGTVNAVCKCP